jgi:hypothetical protein
MRSVSATTLYTAAYDTRAGRARYLWPGLEREQSFVAFTEGTRVTTFFESSAA